MFIVQLIAYSAVATTLPRAPSETGMSEICRLQASSFSSPAVWMWMWLVEEILADRYTVSRSHRDSFNALSGRCEQSGCITLLATADPRCTRQGKRHDCVRTRIALIYQEPVVWTRSSLLKSRSDTGIFLDHSLRVSTLFPCQLQVVYTLQH
jgi:hypothetical protein